MSLKIETIVDKKTNLSYSSLTIDPNLNERLRSYAEKYFSQLSYGQRQRITSFMDEYHKKETTREKEYALDAFRRGRFKEEVFKYFFLKEEIAVDSYAHRTAFEVLEGEEFEAYFQRFYQSWENWDPTTGMSSKILPGYVNPNMVCGMRLLANDSRFNLNLAKLLLDHPKLTKYQRDDILWLWAVSASGKIRKLFNKEEVDFILECERKHEVFIRPVIPSIREVYNLGLDIPESWIIEAYVKNSSDKRYSYKLQGME